MLRCAPGRGAHVLCIRSAPRSSHALPLSLFEQPDLYLDKDFLRGHWPASNPAGIVEDIYFQSEIRN